MPSVGISTSTFRYNRTWFRNGPGPKVPHPFSYSMAAIRVNTNPELFTISNGGAATNVGTATSSQKLALYKKLREKAYASMQMGADFGERRQTIDLVANTLRMVRSPLKTVGEYMRKAARRRGKSFSQMLLKDSADAFLAFQYGVRPLMGSLEDLCDVLKHPYPRYRVRASVPRSDRTRPAYTANNYPKGATAFIQQLKDVSDMRGGFDITVENQVMFSAEQLGLLNPLSVAWELVPFSFVVDWFIPVGTYINSISDYAGCTITNSFCTEFVRTSGYRSYINRRQYCIDESVRCVRTLGVPALPSIFSVPLNLAQSKQHVANALALLISLKR